MNVKRAVAAVAGVIGTLILVAAVGVGYLTGHHSSARPGTAAVAHAVAVTQSGTAHVAASHAAPVTATLDTFIYGDSVSVPAIFGDGLDLWLGTTTSRRRYGGYRQRYRRHVLRWRRHDWRSTAINCGPGRAAAPGRPVAPHSRR